MQRPPACRALFLVLSSLLLLVTLAGRVAAQNSVEADEVLARENRFGNLDRLSPLLSADSNDNQPPTFDISPETRIMHVGERITFRFAFHDPDNDPYFAGVIAVTPRVKLENNSETRKQMQRAASIKIDILPSDDPSVIVWDVTAQNQGVAIFFVSIAELFAITEGGNLKLVSGKIKYVAYALRVVGDTDEGAAPGFLDRLGDMKLRLKERTRLSFAAESPDGRPLSYGFLYLAYASRLVRGKFGPNIMDLKAIEPGKGLFIAYVTDGRKADIETFLLTVADPSDPPEAALKLRALSANAAFGRDQPIPLDLYGENFTPTSQVILTTEAGEQHLPVSFVSATDLRVELPATLRDVATLRVEDGANVTAPLSFRVLGPVVTGIKLLRNEQGAVKDIRILGSGLGRKTRVTAGGQALDLLKDRSVQTKFGGQVVVALPPQLRGEESIELRVSNEAGLESAPINLPLEK